LLAWRLSDTSGLQGEIGQAMLTAYLEEVADVGVTEVHQTRLVVRLDEAGAEELSRRMRELLDEFADRPAPAEGTDVGIYVSWYPSR
jgi:hypothetical protein